MSDDELDIEAKFKAIIDSPEMQVLEERVAADHPRLIAWADDDDITLRLSGDRGLFALNLPLEELQAITVSAVHIMDHACESGQVHLNMMMNVIVNVIYDRLKQEGLLPDELA